MTATAVRVGRGEPARTAPWLLASALLGAAARIAAGALWLNEGILKYRAGFGSADILLVAQGAAGNSRVPFFFRPLGALMQAAPDLFGIAIPALEAGLGLLLVLGLGRVLTAIAALGSIATLMLYWSSDQLIAQYPAMVLLSAVVLALPRAGRVGVAWWWERRRGR
ncbi:hypothetical protein [Microbacterium azadirachtae]|uniref:Thiosulfate dehydrogenase [quinone] large subunit n=1 Tax=Microbacterium azadirachtae TaxID=582680 RepID=A0A0F0LMD6_9MICO|nr:hypothetical protein [Microbacterium azadirachtae]KJL34303.1 hypothetical protein RS86_01090 [Microbacterium azadirachtae]